MPSVALLLLCLLIAPDIATSQPVGAEYSRCLQIQVPHGPLNPRIAVDPSDRKLFKPMARAEVKLLIAFLGQSNLENVSEAEKGILPIERIGVLSQDITAMLAKIHLDETLESLKKMPDVDKGTLEWGVQVAKVMNRCVQMRYRDFGGDLAFKESLRIVQDNRKILESLILERQLPEGKAPVDVNIRR